MDGRKQQDAINLTSLGLQQLCQIHFTSPIASSISSVDSADEEGLQAGRSTTPCLQQVLPLNLPQIFTLCVKHKYSATSTFLPMCLAVYTLRVFAAFL
jgi:hypothetical protein